MIKPAFNPGNIGYGAEIILLRTKQDLTTFLERVRQWFASPNVADPPCLVHS
jgi:hypothetical protein